MYIYYLLRGKQQETAIEREGELSPELFPDVNLKSGPTVINAVIRKLHTAGIDGQWEECILKDTVTGQEESFIRYHNRWTRRSETPYRRVD